MPDESRAAVPKHLCDARAVGLLAPSAVNLWEGASTGNAILLLPVYGIGAVAHTTGL